MGHEVAEILEDERDVERGEKEGRVGAVAGERLAVPSVLHRDEERVGLAGDVGHVAVGRAVDRAFAVDVELREGGLGRSRRAGPERGVVVPLLLEGGLALLAVVVDGLGQPVGSRVGAAIRSWRRKRPRRQERACGRWCRGSETGRRRSEEERR